MGSIETLAPLGAQVILNALLLWFVMKGLPEERKQAREQMDRLNESWMKSIQGVSEKFREAVQSVDKLSAKLERFIDLWVASSAKTPQQANQMYQDLQNRD